MQYARVRIFPIYTRIRITKNYARTRIKGLSVLRPLLVAGADLPQDFRTKHARVSASGPIRDVQAPSIHLFQIRDELSWLIRLAECVGMSVVEWPLTTPDVFSNANTEAELEGLQAFA